ncbi:MAG: endonuclease domain-containing protein [Nitrospirae bacterium]|nr:endonuclease domain-containing protein [Nitrospirota bacterium]
MVDAAKTLRKSQTDAEKLLWKHLRAKQMEGLKFRRQQPIGNYVIDFICLEKSLVIEVDGGQHADNKKDEERDAWLKLEGFKVLRFWNNEVLTNMKGVLEVIRENCLNHPPLTPPLKGGDSIQPSPLAGEGKGEGALFMPTQKPEEP